MINNLQHKVGLNFLKQNIISYFSRLNTR